jgi:hypothetical protein
VRAEGRPTPMGEKVRLTFEGSVRNQRRVTCSGVGPLQLREEKRPPSLFSLPTETSTST